MGVKNMFDGGVTAFYRAIALLEGNNPRRLRLGYLEVGDEVLATHSGTICHNRLMITLSSRTDGQLKRYSPGPLLLRHQIEEAATQGLAFYDLGLGTASYKEKWCDVVEPLFDCCVAFKPHGALLTLAQLGGSREALRQVEPACFMRSRNGCGAPCGGIRPPPTDCYSLRPAFRTAPNAAPRRQPPGSRAR